MQNLLFIVSRELYGNGYKYCIDHQTWSQPIILLKGHELFPPPSCYPSGGYWINQSINGIFSYKTDLPISKIIYFEPLIDVA